MVSAVHRRARRSAASVALLCTGVAVVAAGLATAHLSMTAAGVLVIVLGWVAAASATVPRG
jgi:tryptophan-rich sensory protein